MAQRRHSGPAGAYEAGSWIKSRVNDMTFGRRSLSFRNLGEAMPEVERLLDRDTTLGHGFPEVISAPATLLTAESRDDRLETESLCSAIAHYQTSTEAVEPHSILGPPTEVEWDRLQRIHWRPPPQFLCSFLKSSHGFQPKAAHMKLSNYSLNYTSGAARAAGDFDAGAFLAICRGLGLEGASFHLGDLPSKPDTLRRVRRALLDNGLSLAMASVSSSFGVAESRLSSEQNRVRQAILDACFLGAPLLRVFAGCARE